MWRRGRKDRRKEEHRRRSSVDGKLWRRHGVNRPFLSTDLSVIKRGSKNVYYMDNIIYSVAQIHLTLLCVHDKWLLQHPVWFSGFKHRYLLTKLYRVMSQKCAIFWGTGFKYWPAYRIYVFFWCFSSICAKKMLGYYLKLEDGLFLPCAVQYIYYTTIIRRYTFKPRYSASLSERPMKLRNRNSLLYSI
jgi:hypothetical protein